MNLPSFCLQTIEENHKLKKNRHTGGMRLNSALGPCRRSLSVRLLAGWKYQNRASLASSFETRPWSSFHETRRPLVGNHLRAVPSKVHLDAEFEGGLPTFLTQTSTSLPSLRCFG